MTGSRAIPPHRRNALSMDSVFLGVSETITGFYRALDVHEEPAERFFAHDGVWIRSGQSLTGRSAIRTALQAREASRTSCHLVSNLRVRSLAADRAACDYFVTVYEGKVDVPMRLVTILNAHDELILRDGAWQFAHKHSRRHLPADHG